MAERILVIEDDPDIIESYRLLLELEGYEVIFAQHAFEGVNEVENLQPDLIISDFKLGLQGDRGHFVQMLKRYPPTASIPLIICTAAWREVHRQESYWQDQGVRVIDKPFDIEPFLETIRHLLLLKQTGT